MPRKIHQRVREFLISARFAKGFTQAELAKKMGVTQGRISQIERGKKVPTLEVLEQIARAYGSTLTISFSNFTDFHSSNINYAKLGKGRRMIVHWGAETPVSRDETRERLEA